MASIEQIKKDTVELINAGELPSIIEGVVERAVEQAWLIKNVMKYIPQDVDTDSVHVLNVSAFIYPQFYGQTEVDLGDITISRDNITNELAELFDNLYPQFTEFTPREHKSYTAPKNNHAIIVFDMLDTEEHDTVELKIELGF